MKTQHLFYLYIFLTIVTVGCKDEIPNDPDSGLAIYKTRTDYFNNVHTNLKDGEVYYKQSLLQKVDFDENGKMHYRFRIKLDNGYILAAEHGIHTAFLSYTIEYYYNLEINGLRPGIQEITDRIIDNDPFLELYYDTTHPHVFQWGDTTLINEIIKNGELETYFKRFK